jgi:DNA-binding MarR family transcriptional regulator/GNAT superfamily N-acetyltransferase
MDRASTVAALRHFNRFYTREIGLLNEKELFDGLSLAEGRVLFELAQTSPQTAKDIGENLQLDAGYLSRMLRSFEKRKLISRKEDVQDRRRALLALTEPGRKKFAKLNQLSEDAVGTMIAELPEARRKALVGAMQRIERLLLPAGTPQVTVRDERIGDMGIVTARQGQLYAREFGWDGTYEALVAKILSDYGLRNDRIHERGWIAELDGDVVGSVYVMKENETTARLRLLYVDDAARGTGLGRKLVQLCTDFARSAGYQRIVLWTQSMLIPARKIYTAEGYRLINSEPHHSFGHDLVGETWELLL